MRRILSVVVLLAVCASAACAIGGAPIDVGPTIKAIVDAVAANVTPPAPTVDPPPVVEPPAPEPIPEPPAVEPPPLVNLNIVVLDAAGAGIRNAGCAISGATESGQPETRTSNNSGDGFINFAVRGSVLASCSAVGFQTRSADLPPGSHPFALVSIAPPAPPNPVDPPPASTCAAIECVRQAEAKYRRLLDVNLFETCMEFTQRVLELLGPEWGHVGKTRSESQSVPRGFVELDAKGADGKTYHITGVSHDAIKHRVTGQVIDLLSNATANEHCDPSTLPAGEKCWPPGPASIQWLNVPEFRADGAKQWRDSNPFVPAVPVR